MPQVDMTMSILMSNHKVRINSTRSSDKYAKLCAGDIGKFIPTRRTPGVSTSDLLERIVSGYRKRDFDAKLEKIGHAELKAAGSDFDDSPAASRPQSRPQSRTRGRRGTAGANAAPPS